MIIELLGLLFLSGIIVFGFSMLDEYIVETSNDWQVVGWFIVKILAVAAGLGILLR